MPPRVLHLSTYDANGGAARAAYALHRAMVDGGVESRLLVGRSGTGDPTVLEVGASRFRAASELDRATWRLQRSANTAWRSPARFGALSAAQVNASGADIVNLHWVTDGFLSIRGIGRITKPIVWSLVDMWPFSGTEHYGADTPDARWRTGYTAANRPAGDRGLDLDRLAWQAKRQRWARPMTIVAASTWMRERVTASALMRDWPLARVPHVIDCEAFRPADRSTARQRLGLPQGTPLVLFLSSAGVGDPRKGWDLLEAALPKVRSTVPDVEVVVAGPPGHDRDAAPRVHWLGHVAGNDALRDAYAAADVTVVPSREDNMPLTAMEAQSCGRPVVAFSIGGLPDIVAHGRTGFLAPAFDTDALADGITGALLDALGQDAWGSAARARALATWSAGVVVPAYLDLYSRIVA